LCLFCGKAAVATEEAPIAIGSGGSGGIDARKTSKVVGLVKVGVIHGHVAINRYYFTIDVEPPSPKSIRFHAVPEKRVIRAVVLGAANGKFDPWDALRTHELVALKSHVIKAAQVAPASTDLKIPAVIATIEGMFAFGDAIRPRGCRHGLRSWPNRQM